ncbi:MAG TPA: acyltransferase [Verrucomicrobiae bacterium]|jgi:peptidoglycan/LPS O-acetylase OafA/YrhL|nr:acyltransferase [Verrucomicrobiae bacterium]
MATSLSDAVDQKRNNLNAVRLFLAATVLAYHCSPLTRGADHHQGILPYFGDTAVDLFFLISGLLITASWQRSKSAADFLRKRVLRIFPGFIGAYAFAVAAMTWANSAVLNKLISFHGLGGILTDCVTLTNYMLRGSGVFPLNPYFGSADGSLWTIPYEFGCYLLVAIAGILCLFKYRWLAIAGLIAAYALFCNSVLQGAEVTTPGRRFLTYFLVGMSCWLWREKIPLRGAIVFLALAIMFAAAFSRPVWLLFEPICLSYVCLWIGFTKPWKATRWCDHTDLSYGVYLYAFTVQQIIATTAWGRNPFVMLAIATPATALMAYLSWTLIEKRCLALKPVRHSNLRRGEIAATTFTTVGRKI